MIECSSAVTMAPVSCAQRTISSAVHRLDGMHLHNAKPDALPRKHPRRFNGSRHHHAARNHGRVVAIDQRDSFPIFGSYRSVKTSGTSLRQSRKYTGPFQAATLRQAASSPPADPLEPRSSYWADCGRWRNRRSFDASVRRTNRKARAYAPANFTLAPADSKMRPHHLQSARVAKKKANVLAMGTLPLLASPTATSTSAGSAMPTLINRSGNAASNI